MNIKKNISLIIAIAVPILMIIFVAASIYLPRFFIHPQYNFLYVTGDYSEAQRYAVDDTQLVKNDLKQPDNYNYRGEAKLYIYDVGSDQSTEVAFIDTRELNLNSNRESVDGFEIVSGDQSHGLFPFSFSSDHDYCSRYISGHNLSRKLVLKQTSSSNGCGNFRFLAWVQ